MYLFLSHSFYIFVCTLENPSCFLFLATEKSEIKDGYIWITKYKKLCTLYMFRKKIQFLFLRT